MSLATKRNGNLKNAAPGVKEVLPHFSKGSDGTADFGKRYDPTTGDCLTVKEAPRNSPYALSDNSAVPYSVSLAQTTYTEVKKHTTSLGRTTCSYKDWDHQRYKHARIKENPQQRHTKPITSSMEIGWNQDWPLKRPLAGTPQCKETKIADAHILGPRYVDVIAPTTKLYF